jgi:ssDNA-binding Zn-finger/Zn-ribbon topoisomerase 1
MANRHTKKFLGKNPRCPKCQSEMVLRYSVRRQKSYYLCSNKCDIYITAHPNGDPVGIPAERVVRELRQHTHSLANKIWEYKNTYQREKMYKWLEKNSVSGHIGRMGMEELGEVITKLNKIIKKFK